MAESMVEEPLGFFCHRCWMEIRPVLPSYLCPHCSTGFIEELDSAQTPPPPETDITMEDYNFIIDPNSLANNPFLPRYIRERSSRPGGAVRSDRPRPMAYLRGDRPDLAIRRGLDALRDRIAELHRVDFYARDYAWNGEGLDAIVTHLLNQMDVSGPPPLAKERIDEIPIVNIVQNQVDASLQCPVCWEDFRIEESVRKLMCDHLFHENCIIPWLELHGTCPVCRKWLFEESSPDDPNQEHEESSGLNELQRPEELSTLLIARQRPEELNTLRMSSSLELLAENPIPLDATDDPGNGSHDMSCG